ncbi:hypothetical protein D3C76_579470 [compost metagenome]
MHAEKRLAMNQAAFVHQREIVLRHGRGNRLVALVDTSFGEQPLVGTAALRVGGKQHKPGGMPVDTVQRHQMRVAQAADQAAQQGLLDVFTSRRHW